MVTNNKVLTVSYGTFSCTLEGFEESFDTMKAIAEYFRDLAADDRYFGAEPPTPDAEMLARIAEREIERRVRARVDHGAIVLSAAADESETQTPAAPTVSRKAGKDSGEDRHMERVDESIAVADAAKDTPEDIAKDIAEDIPAETPAVAALALDPAIEEQDFEIAPDDAADDAADIATAQEAAQTEASDAVAESEPTPPPVAEAMVDTAPENSAAAAEVTEEFAPEEIEDDIEDMTAAPDTATQAQPQDEDEGDAEFEHATTSGDDAEDMAEDESFAAWEDDEDEEDPEYAENSIAAKLERIRAVVSRVETDPDDDFSEDEHAEDMGSEPAPAADPMASIKAAIADEDTKAPTDTDQDEIVGEDEISIADEDTPQPLRARVVRMKKADFEEAVASGLLEAEPVDDDEDDMAGASDGSSLSPEEEAELLAELAEVEAELGQPVELDPHKEDALLLTDAVALPGEDDAPGDASHDTATHDTSRNKAPGAQALNQVAGTDDDLSRLMAKADSEMDEPEGSRRRRAIAHLRAAVKATNAEKEAGSNLSPRDHSDAYRDDLASVVRAVPGSAADTDGRPRETRKSTAPLKLVAEQRVDTPAPKTPAPAAPEAAQEPAETTETTETTQSDTSPRAPVRPRRVSADRIDRDEAARAAAPVGSSKAVQGGFRDYAESVGATRLPEVLEAAAAYITFVEGHERFSRPMLMRMARDANEDDFSREIGLRSFGQLLREKKIEKIAGGRFTAMPTINFKPDDRAVG